MKSVTLFGIAAAVLVLFLATGNEVSAYPDPCLLWSHHHRHHEKTTSTTTKKPTAESLEETSIENKKETFRKLEKLIGAWLFSEPVQQKTTTSTTTTKPPPAPAQYNKNPMEEFLSNYMNFMSYLFSF